MGANSRPKRLLRRFAMANEQTAIERNDPGNGSLDLLSVLAERVGVVIVSVVEVAPANKVRMDGLKLQLAPEGSPEQVNATGEWNPLAGVMVTVVVAVWPPVTVTAEGAAVIVKSADWELIVYVAVATGLAV